MLRPRRPGPVAALPDRARTASVPGGNPGPRDLDLLPRVAPLRASRLRAGARQAVLRLGSGRARAVPAESACGLQCLPAPEAAPSLDGRAGTVRRTTRLHRPRAHPTQAQLGWDSRAGCVED